MPETRRSQSKAAKKMIDTAVKEEIEPSDKKPTIEDYFKKRDKDKTTNSPKSDKTILPGQANITEIEPEEGMEHDDEDPCIDDSQKDKSRIRADDETPQHNILKRQMRILSSDYWAPH